MINIQIPKHLINYFESLRSRHGIELSQGQKMWYTHQYNTLGEKIKQEYPSTPDEAFLGSDDALFYARELEQIKEANQITNVRYDRSLPVYCSFDIGYSDATSVWFFQCLPSRDVHIIDFYENNKEDVSHYVSILNNKGYVYEKLFLPHDARNHNVATGVSVEEQFGRFGFKTQILERCEWTSKTFIQQIQQVRNLLIKCWFDEDRCSVGLKALSSYRKRWNESLGMYASEAVHDKYSHAADSFRYLAQAVSGLDTRPNQNALKDEIAKMKAYRRMRV